MRLFFILLGLTLSTLAMAQKSVIEGVVKDESTGETLIGANIVFADNPSRGTAANIDGYFKLEVQPGTYKLVVSYIGYKSKTITAKAGGPSLEITLKSEMLDEVEVVADVAIDRKTPVAFMNIKASKIQEELAGRDLPMLLNTTPGVYATQQGGGDGDAEIRMRGFEGRFVGVLLDGIPVNDMENGTVYWSNWFGLSAITRTLQTQRGLGSSKLAIPSIGGTINILTKGIENKRSANIKQSLDQYGKFTTTGGFNSGEIGNGWSFSVAGSYKTGGGWVDAMYTDAYFYFAKVNKRIKKHTLSFTTYGAPQEHIQRSGKLRIANFDTDFAKEQGIDPSVFPTYNSDMGIGYNRNWGLIKRTRYNENATNEKLFLNRNNYYKPMFYLKDFWSINDKLSVYNIAYMSIGRGGGISGIKEEDGTGTTIDYDPNTGQAMLQSFYDQNAIGGLFTGPPINPTYSDTEYQSKYVTVQQRNDHMWYGFLSNVNYKASEPLTLDFGVDLRSYEGTHYGQIDDLLGGDYYIDSTDKRIDYTNNAKAKMKRVGDKVLYYSTSFAKWGGTYFQAEYSTPVYSALINVTGSMVNYSKDDYFGDAYSKSKNFYGWTIKGGFNYNATETINVFVNGGYYDKVQMLTYSFDGYSVNFNDAIDNEHIKSVEIGAQYKTPLFSTRLNAYLTNWENTVRYISSYEGYEDIPLSEGWYGRYVGLDAKHLGIEWDFTLKPIKQLEIKGWASLGDWKWDTDIKNLTLIYDPPGDNYFEYDIDFNISDLYVGGSAQTQLGGQVRYEPFKGLYGTLTATYFDRYYADFDPESTRNEDGSIIQAWQAPSYTLLDFHAGYKFDFPWYDKVKIKVGFNVLNILDTRYITAAQDNAEVNGGGIVDMDHSAAAAGVFFGPPRRFMANLAIYF
ncbi:MAG: hypothetical protein C0599_16195 [Salinivirgaceae bacterium]|nr:MAG: hypothetical protein C0599_16195 [Salinivirgaceae bacterium]